MATVSSSSSSSSSAKLEKIDENVIQEHKRIAEFEIVTYGKNVSRIEEVVNTELNFATNNTKNTQFQGLQHWFRGPLYVIPAEKELRDGP